MPDFAPDLKKILRAHGFEFVRRGKGDHDIGFSPLSGCRFPVDARIKSRHTANGVLKQTGLQKQF